MPNEDWFTCLPSCEARVPCGSGQHLVRWEAGELRLPSHADPEAELVLAALGGEKARCVEIAEAWGRHAADLTVLGIGPRGPADKIQIGWEDVDAAGQAEARGGWAFSSAPGPGQVPPGQGPMRRPSTMLAAAIAQASARRPQAVREQAAARQRRTDMMSLLALGHEFQVRLAGQVVAAHAGRLGEPGEPGEPGRSRRPVLTQALEGRLALVAERWLGIDPDCVKATLHTGPGWGSAELTGQGGQRRLRVSLAADWLARVWACHLALVSGHLVVAVDRAGWPDARVLALRAPGAEPVLLDAHGAPDGPHWEI